MHPPQYFAALAECDLPADVAWLTTADGTRLRRIIWGTARRGHVILLTGRSEYIEKYGRIAGKLAARGYAVVCIDWRGQGLSDHLDGRRDIGHVDDFSEYQDDFQTLLADPAVAALPGPRLMFAHSMGGCIGLRALLNGFSAAAVVFSAPMWGIAVNRYVKPLGEALAQAGAKLGKGTLRMPGTKAKTYVLSDPFEDNLLTGDRESWDWLQSHARAQPDLVLGGPTLRWIDAAREEFERFDAEDMPKTPVLTLLGSEENLIDASAVRRQMARFENGRLVEIPKSRHEIWMERAALQKLAWQAVDAFLTEQGAQ